jgi:Uma2 family endonuclease
MLRIGILKEGERVELLDGLILEKMTIYPPHSYAVGQLNRLLTRLLDDGWDVRIQQPISIPSRDSEPEPDVLVALGPAARYIGRHPAPKDVALVIEVADSSLSEDQTAKLAVYAAAKLPTYWIVNLQDRRVEVYTEPRGGKNPTYRARQDCGPDDAVPIVLAGRTLGSLAVAEILPR